MDSKKKQPRDSDGSRPTKIPPLSSRPSSQLTSRVSRNAIPSLSKIPKRDAGNISTPKKAPAAVRSIARPVTRPICKPIDTKKASRSTLSLGLTKTTPRSHALALSRSNMNTQRSLKSKNPTPRSQRSEPPAADKFLKPTERAAAKKNVLAFEGMKEKVRTCQTEFMKKWEIVKNELPPDEGEYKLIGLVKNSDGQLLTAQTVKVRCPQKTLEQFKKDMHDYVQNNLNGILDSLDQFKTSSAKVGSGKGQECLNAIEEVKKKITMDNLNTLGDILKQIEGFESCDKPGGQTGTAKKVDELRENLEQTQKELARIKKIDEDKEISYKKELEERDKKFAEKQSEVDELKNKLESFEEDGSKYKAYNRELVDKLNNKTAEIEDLKKKLKTYSQSNVSQQNKSQEYETRVKKLEADLKAALKDVERGDEIEYSIGDQATKHADEMRSLKGDLSNFKKENERLQKEIHQLNIEIIRDRELDTQLLIFKNKVKQLDAEDLTLRQSIKELENKLQASESQIRATKDINDELANLQKSESEKSQKIEVLEMELTKANFQSQKLEEKIAMDRKLLKVRSCLIESLQSKDSTQKIHLEDLTVQLGERNNDIQMLKTDLQAKTEEFQKLFSTLSDKQLELTQQEHVIKLLEESNERTQMVRVRQEAKVARLEEEVAQLKHTISLYQEAVLPNNVLRKNLLLAEASRDSDSTDNLGYYVDERRRKRHIDITVKKYEK